MSTQGTNQHYVPQFLLRPFGAGKKKSRLIWRLDKTNSSVAQVPVKEVASGPGFYDLFGSRSSLDPLMGQLETATAPLIRRLIEREGIHLFSLPEKRKLAFFVVVQMLRTPAQFEDNARKWQVTQQILTKLTKKPLQNNIFPEGSDLRDSYVKTIAHLAPALADHLMDKSWILEECPPGVQFYTSDNPVSRHNPIPAPPFRGNLGLGCEGICVELPLSPRLCLSIACSKTVSELALRDIRYAYAFGAGRPLPLVRANVEFLNSLQVIHAERYVFAATNDFGMAQSMLAEHPDLRRGPRSLVIHPFGDSYPESELERAKEIFQKRAGGNCR